MRTVTLSDLRTRALRLADLESNNSWMTSAEVNTYINEAIAKWWDLIASSPAQEWFKEWYISQTEPNIDVYPLDPAPQGWLNTDTSVRLHAQTDFYKCLGVDVIYGDLPRLDSGNPQLTRSGSGYLSLPRGTRRVVLSPFMNNERNWPNDYSIWYSGDNDITWAHYAPRYRISGDIRTDLAGQFQEPDATQSESEVIGNFVSTKYNRIPLLTFVPAPESYYWYRVWYMPHAPVLTSDSQVITTINGWEEYIVADAAIKMLVKEESDISGCLSIKQSIEDAIRNSSSEQDISSYDVVQDFYTNTSGRFLASNAGSGTGTQWIASTVFDPSELPVMSIEVSPASAVIGNGATQQFTCTATYTNGSTGDITNSPLLTWSSSDPAVATINDAGLATSVDVDGGTITVTATYTTVS